MMTFMSSNYSGAVIAMVVVLVGACVFFLGHGRREGMVGRSIKLVGSLCIGAGALLLVASSYHLLNVWNAHKTFPPLGQLVDVGGYKMHMLAEGDARGGATIVWMSGRHDSGLVLYHLHKEMAKTRRSIIFDRPGSGWSDTGPFPRTVAREAQELHAMLKMAGEKGPFVLVPWSFSGLLAINFAELYPQDTTGLALLDTTDPAGPVFDRDTMIRSMCKTEEKYAWLARFGWGWGRLDRLPKEQKEQFMTLYAPIAGVQQAIVATNAQPRFHMTVCSALRSSALDVFSSTQSIGALGQMPVTIVIPPDLEARAERMADLFFKTENERRHARDFLIDAKNRLANLSSQVEIVISPPGTTHSLPFEAPEFVLDQVNQMADRFQVTSRPQ